MNTIHKPDYNDAPIYCHYYFDLLSEDHLLSAFTNTRDLTVKLFSGVPLEKEVFAYDNGKWNIKELLSHIIDTERVLAYRALRFSRRDATELAGFDEDTFVAQGNVSQRTLEDLIHEYLLVRDSSSVLFSYLNNEMLDFGGMANKVMYTPRALGWMMAGHNLHHCMILRDRYLTLI